MSRPLTISISGGGALGVGPLAYMKLAEKDFGFKFADKAVAFAGTSTGAIIAGCLDEGMSADRIHSMYRDNLKAIFDEYSVWQKIKKCPCPKYDNSALKKLLCDNLSGKCSDWKKPIFIPSFDMSERDDRAEKIYDLGDSDVDKAFAVLASASAPTYFYPAGPDRTMLDGGLIANNPSMLLQAGLVDSAYGRDIKMLYFDTGMTSTAKGTSGNKNDIAWLRLLINRIVARTQTTVEYEVRKNIGDYYFMKRAPLTGTSFDMDDRDSVQKVEDIWTEYYAETKGLLASWLTR